MSPLLLAISVSLGATAFALGLLLVVFGRRLASLRLAMDDLRRRIESIEFAPPVTDSRREAPPGDALEVAPTTDHPPSTPRHDGSLAPRKDDLRASPEPAPTTRIVAEFNELAAQYSQSTLDAFVQCWRPDRLARNSENRLVGDPNGEFWVIRTDAASTWESRGLIVPGPEIVRKWEIYYRSMGSLAAKNLLDFLYELSEGAPLRLDRPAVAIETAQGWKVDKLGKLADS